MKSCTIIEKGGDIMYCHQCGKEIGESKFCPYCGASLESQSSQPGTYQPIQQNVSYTKEEDEPSFGFALLSFFIPIAGLVLYCIWSKEYPMKAKSCLKGFISSIVLGIVVFCCGIAAITSFWNETDYYYDDPYDFYYNTYAQAIVETVDYD